MSPPVYIVTAHSEEGLAEPLAKPLRDAGFTVVHNGTVAVGDSLIGEAMKALQAGAPVVLCATVRAVGSAWAHQLVNAAHAMTTPRVYVVQMDADAYVEQLGLHTRPARYCDDPDRACRELVAAVSKHSPPAAAPPPADTTERQFLDGRTEEVSFDIDALARFREELRPEALAHLAAELAPWDFLDRAGLLKDKFLTRTGVLLVGSAPTRVLSTAMVRCAHYRGRDRSAARQVVPIAGTVPQQIIQARQFVADRVRLGEGPAGDRAQAAPRYAYPMIAVREVIANALAHRDYERADGCVSVRLFDDRLEISSPGAWYGRSSAEEVRCDLAAMEGDPRHRNYWLAHVLTWIRLVEGEGSGIPAAVADCLDERAPSPEVLLREGEVTVVLRPGADRDDAAGFGSRRAALIGRVADAELAKVRSVYVPPDSHDPAVRTLAGNGLLILAGPRGTGRRTAAIRLLQEMTDGPITTLSPVSTPRELAERSYQPGGAYLVTDMAGANDTANDNFHWNVIRDRLQEAQAYAVVTTVTAAAGAPVVNWHRPDVLEVLRAHLAATGRDHAAQLKAIAPVLPPECSVGSVAELARRIAGGADPEQAVQQVDEVLATEVSTWFGSGPSPREILEVTALAFVEVAGVRAFETLEADLELLISEEFPAAVRPGGSVRYPNALPQRRALTGARDLIRVDRGTVRFKLPGYRRYALAELVARFDVSFWGAVWKWIRKIAGNPAAAGLPSGLAALASVDFTEVQVSFLEPSSTGGHGEACRTAAVDALSAMSRDTGLAPAALDTVTRWLDQGEIEQQRTALLALGTDLGARFFSTDMVHHLTLLALTDGLRADAGTALAALLARETEDGAGTRERRMDAVGRRWAELLTARETRPDAVAGLLALVRALIMVGGRSATLTTDLGSAVAGHLSGEPMDAFTWELLHAAPAQGLDSLDIMGLLRDARRAGGPSAR